MIPSSNNLDMEALAIESKTRAGGEMGKDLFSGPQLSEFLERIYNSKDRSGKVVYRYA
jgi:hypothetical protein